MTDLFICRRTIDSDYTTYEPIAPYERDKWGQAYKLIAFIANGVWTESKESISSRCYDFLKRNKREHPESIEVKNDR